MPALKLIIPLCVLAATLLIVGASHNQHGGPAGGQSSPTPANEAGLN